MALKIDLKDRKILYELDRDSRQSNKEIARKVGLSEQVVGNRIKRLIDKGVIEYFFVKTNPSVLGYMHVKVYLRFHNLTREREEALVTHLNQQKNIFWIATLRGKYDLEISLHVKTVADFSKRYEELFAAWGDYILERNVIVLEQAFTYTKSHFLPQQKSEAIIYTVGEEKPMQIDETDSALLKLLNREGRKPLIELAQLLQVSADTVRYRLNCLKKQHVITGFGVKIDYRKLGNQYHLIFLKLQNMTLQKYKTLAYLAQTNRNVVIYMKTIGDHDIELEVETTTHQELDDLMKSLRDTFVSEIKQYELLEVIREHRMTYFPF